MNKATTVQARMTLQLKQQADLVLKKIGLSPSQVINALYSQIVLLKGIPFELKMPNKETLNAIQELEQGQGKKFSSFKEMVDDLDNQDA